MQASQVLAYAETFLAVSGALSVIFGSTWAIAKLTMRTELMPSLRARKDEFRSWSSDLYSEELKQTRQSVIAIDTIERSLDSLQSDLKSIRMNIGKHDEILVALPGILTSLNETLSRHARTDDKLGDILTQLSKDVSDTKVHVAHIMGKLSMEPRRDPHIVSTGIKDG